MPAVYSVADIDLSSLEPEAFGRVSRGFIDEQANILKSWRLEEIIENNVTGWLVEPNNPES